MKKIKTNFLFALLLIGVVLVAVVSASVSSESGVLSFDEEHNKTVEIKNDSNRNKRVNLELSVQDDHQVTGSVLVEVVNNDGSIALKEDLTAGIIKTPIRVEKNSIGPVCVPSDAVKAPRISSQMVTANIPR
jgi:hypothetical protein